MAPAEPPVGGTETDLVRRDNALCSLKGLRLAYIGGKTVQSDVLECLEDTEKRWRDLMAKDTQGCVRRYC